jgi:uncharacterized protein (DUF2252 family)
MAADLAALPRSGIDVQACGDAHVSNFGTFATPERHQVFDLNDFDETRPGPWEWDLLRLTTSLVLTARENGFEPDVGSKAVAEAVQFYAEGIAGLAAASALDVWYSRVDLAELERTAPRKSSRRRVGELREAARKRTGAAAATKLTEVHEGTLRLRHRPPFLVPIRELAAEFNPEAARRGLTDVHASYVSTLPEERHRLLDEYEVVDAALKVVGVGSVGTRCFIVLLLDRATGTPLVLQVKEAGESVLAAHLPPGPAHEPGERVVRGQRAIQTTADIFLGWTRGEEGRSYYIRQLRDMKGSVDLATMTPGMLRGYARLCGGTLALAHAGSGDRHVLTGYVGDGTELAAAAAAFAARYAGQVESDHARFLAEVPDASAAG